MVGTETASAISTRGIYITDKPRNWMSAYDTNHPAWAELVEEWWTFYAQRDYLAGGFAWTGFDYRGEPTPYGWPSISSQFGIVDMCGFPKDSFYYYKAWWQPEPVLHLFPIGTGMSVSASRSPSGFTPTSMRSSSFLNGKSLGSQKMKPLGHLEWKVPYQPGTLEARGKKNGAIALTAKRETTGTPASLRLTADRTTIDADGEDLAILRVEALDAQGRPVPVASDRVDFKVTGAGAFLGVGNGDPNCQEPDNKPQRSLFNGLAQLIVQSTKVPGEITVEATSPGSRLPATRLAIKTSRATPRPVRLRNRAELSADSCLSLSAVKSCLLAHASDNLIRNVYCRKSQSRKIHLHLP